MTQETYLFHDSVENNIKVAKPDATREEVIKAAKKASLHSFIESLPKGYDTPVGRIGEISFQEENGSVSESPELSCIMRRF